jgi:uncharacterized YccA/Bax inhibitor family protein
MRTANPTLIDDNYTSRGYIPVAKAMTIQGVIIKSAVLLLLVLLSAAWTWSQFVKSGGEASSVSTWMTVGAIGGLILAFATVFKPAWSAITAPIYAVLEGFVIGGLSALMEQAFPGIVMQATLLTFGTLAAMLAVYQSGLIRVTEGFKMGIMAATGGIAIAYLISWILSFFNIQVPFIYGNGIGSILFSLFVVIVAALNFVLDFDFIEKGARRGIPKYMEWYSGFALMVTLIWLYIEFLRLLAKMRSRD